VVLGQRHFLPRNENKLIIFNINLMRITEDNSSMCVCVCVLYFAGVEFPKITIDLLFTTSRAYISNTPLTR
jgi:hypothetical protein